jgi:hypothetical protein
MDALTSTPSAPQVRLVEHVEGPEAPAPVERVMHEAERLDPVERERRGEGLAWPVRDPPLVRGGPLRPSARYTGALSCGFTRGP